jgi:3'(2'), 5'-bisphosphate nucleotidase
MSPQPGSSRRISPRALARVVDIGRRAGDVVMTFYGRASAVRQKGNLGPVTQADIASHELIAQELSAWDDSLPIISEEADVPAYHTRRDWARFWMIDPLDGTKEFLSVNGEFTVNIALIEHGRPVLGVVVAPALGVTYFAASGLGAYRQEGDGSIPPRPGQPLRVVESRSHPCPQLESYLATLPVSARLQVGSSLKFCWLADGRADVYARLSPLMEWDAAAGDCVFRLSGESENRASPLCYNGASLRIDRFVLGLDDYYSGS